MLIILDTCILIERLKQSSQQAMQAIIDQICLDYQGKPVITAPTLAEYVQTNSNAHDQFNSLTTLPFTKAEAIRTGEIFRASYGHTNDIDAMIASYLAENTAFLTLNKKDFPTLKLIHTYHLNHKTAKGGQRSAKVYLLTSET